MPLNAPSTQQAKIAPTLRSLEFWSPTLWPCETSAAKFVDAVVGGAAAGVGRTGVGGAGVSETDVGVPGVGASVGIGVGAGVSAGGALVGGTGVGVNAGVCVDGSSVGAVGVAGVGEKALRSKINLNIGSHW